MDYRHLQQGKSMHGRIVQDLGMDIVGGKVAYASAEYSKLAPPALPVSPDWSPVKHYGGYRQAATSPTELPEHVALSTHRWVFGEKGFWELGCDCFA